MAAMRSIMDRDFGSESGLARGLSVESITYLYTAFRWPRQDDSSHEIDSFKQITGQKMELLCISYI